MHFRKDVGSVRKRPDAAGMKPGKEIGDTLNAFLELVLEDPEKNTKEYLLSKVRESL